MVSRQWLRVDHVDRGMQPLAAQLGHEVIGHDDRPASHVHEQGAVLHPGQERGVDQAAGLRRGRDGVHPISALARLLPDADVVILIVPLTEETRGLVDTDFLARMKDGALLVNVARGPVVNTDALLAELTSGRLSAAVDVTDPEPLPAEHPLWQAPNLVVTPHVGGASSAMWPRAHRLIRDQLHRFAHGEPLANVMDGDY